ncbi:3-dehydroquinate synthase [Aequorivita sublithincola DSM 14238]|uniref:3-dehydroquinate synthase n=1 Tax=Aequorivita sublithincola (strain DSM 14238 / LMG 21431 / ACAM 643 / 9-3) TaxID=746697 RepID=I3YYM6_AEQSU|nr:3-dehydroquinate synthase [Aequorivita sublithincola]AFL82094.1 3-dehydroquinate synthase [Aequorivita sublithincola DSM 14238]
MGKALIEKGQIYRNEEAWELFSNLITEITPSKVFVIADENTNKHCLPYFLKKINFEKSPEIITIPAGEIEKNISTCLKVWEILSDKGADRTSLIINLGGGVVTDLGGFVASTFKRGLRFINVPTSLLAMVDASVGGKNGVDLGHIKNQIGVINLPEMVILDTAFLETLPSEHITSGLAEMLKHGIIQSEAYWKRIKNINRENKVELNTLIWDSIEIKKAIVAKDPFEKNLRKTLNYGHTLGHAIESYFLENPNKKTLLHGESVAAGIILATYISKDLYGFPENKLQDISESMFKHFPKQTFSKKDIEAIINLLIFDKKNRNGKVLFVLLEDIGRHKTDCVVSNKLIFRAFEYYKNF